MIDNPAGWIGKKSAATTLNYFIGQLMYNKGVELVLYRNSLNEVSISELLSLHEYAREIVGQDIEIETSALIAEALMDLDITISKIDIGKLNSEWIKRGDEFDSLKAFLKDELKALHKDSSVLKKPVDVVLYGFGRIGRLCARAIIDMTGIGAQLRLRAIVTRNNSPEQMVKRADLLRMDSVHGPFKGVIRVDAENQKMIVNGEEVHMIAASDPSSIDYAALGINNALVIDNTGVWRNEETLSQHLKSNGIKKSF